MKPRNYYLITPLANTGLLKGLTYHSPEIFEPGQVVEITLGRRRVIGVVEYTTAKPTFTTKPVTAIVDVTPLPPDIMALAHWMATYYATDVSSVWTTMLPAGIAKQRRELKTTGAIKPPRGLPTEELTADQAAALAAIRASPLTSHLVQGVTGSGKTRLYLELARESIEAGKSVIILVPEITLTDQMIRQFEAAFGTKVLASHSKLTEARRHHIWQQAQAAADARQTRIIIGPRSCIFMPTSTLGLVVIDECHETSYKQERAPRYQTISTAAFRARFNDARLILGSATPGLGELYWAQQGKLNHILMQERANRQLLPEAKIIDLRAKNYCKLSKFITQDLYEAIEQTLQQNRQTLLYINRRGSASSQICDDCGHVTTCPNCLLPLTFHADLMRLVCHHCNFRVANAAVCTACGSAALKLLGAGTKRIEADVMRLFPHARVARLDRDSATLPMIQAVLGGLRKREIDIIVGTQMIAKGLDLPAIDTIGVINADTMLHLPDFSAAERTFQLLTQVAGRAGRGDRPGRVFIQTYSPQHPAIQAAGGADYTTFATAELEQRKLLGYPPFRYLLKLEVSTTTREAAVEKADIMAVRLKNIAGVAVAGPAPAFAETVAGAFRWMITITSPRRPILVEIAANLNDPAWTADLDPVNLL